MRPQRRCDPLTSTLTFKTETETTKRLVCFLEELEKVGGDKCELANETAFQECAEKDFSEETIKVGLKFFPVPPAPPASCPETPKPCSEEFTHQFYEGMARELRECMPCGGVPTDWESHRQLQKTVDGGVNWVIAGWQVDCIQVCTHWGTSCVEGHWSELSEQDAKTSGTPCRWGGVVDGTDGPYKGADGDRWVCVGSRSNSQVPSRARPGQVPLFLQ